MHMLVNEQVHAQMFADCLLRELLLLGVLLSQALLLCCLRVCGGEGWGGG